VTTSPKAAVETSKTAAPWRVATGGLSNDLFNRRHSSESSRPASAPPATAVNVAGGVPPGSLAGQTSGRAAHR
jgi:hypothetical protein